MKRLIRCITILMILSSTPAWAQRCAKPDMVRTFEFSKNQGDNIVFIGHFVTTNKAKEWQLLGQGYKLNGTLAEIQKLPVVYKIYDQRRLPQMPSSEQEFLVFPTMLKVNEPKSGYLLYLNSCSDRIFSFTPFLQKMLNQCFNGACPSKLNELKGDKRI